MKSRWAKASVRRSVMEAPAPDTTSSNVRRKTHAADPSPLAIVTAPRASGHTAPVESVQPTAMHPNTAAWTRLSPQKSRIAPRRDSMSLSRASSPSPPSRIEWARQRSAPTSWYLGDTRREIDRRAAALAEQLAGASAARRAREDAGRVRGHDHRGQRRIDVDRLRGELRVEERPEPARLGNEVRRHDHDTA